MSLVLHVGCGRQRLPAELFNGCPELRVDIDPSVNPDVVASMTDLGDIGLFTAVWCCHSLEHLHPSEGLKALQEFVRVLKPGGAAIVIVPDLQDVQPTDEVVYESSAGPITGHDMIYGWRAHENAHMLHRTGFISATLEAVMTRAGFARVDIVRDRKGHQLIGTGWK